MNLFQLIKLFSLTAAPVCMVNTRISEPRMNLIKWNPSLGGTQTGTGNVSFAIHSQSQ